MSYVSTSCPYTQEWKSTSERHWTCEGPVDAPVGPMNWDDWNMQLSLMQDLINNKPRVDTQLIPFKCDGNKFEIRLDLSHFAPEEFNVKIVDKELVIECKHDDKKDKHGFVSRQFTRKFRLPEDVELEKVKSTLSSAGILTVEVPKKIYESKSENVVYIPIIHEKDLVNGKDEKKDGESENKTSEEKTKESQKTKSEVKTETTVRSEVQIEVKHE